jgi:hypothetical protein
LTAYPEADICGWARLRTGVKPTGSCRRELRRHAAAAFLIRSSFAQGTRVGPRGRRKVLWSGNQTQPARLGSIAERSPGRLAFDAAVNRRANSQGPWLDRWRSRHVNRDKCDCALRDCGRASGDAGGARGAVLVDAGRQRQPCDDRHLACDDRRRDRHGLGAPGQSRASCGARR